MASPITDKQRREFEAYIAEHEPYPDDAPEMNQFDGEQDLERALASLMKQCLDEADKESGGTND